MVNHRNLEEILSERGRMELIWVANGIKPVGEIKNGEYEHKQILDSFGFYTEIYENRIFCFNLFIY